MRMQSLHTSYDVAGGSALGRSCTIDGAVGAFYLNSSMVFLLLCCCLTVDAVLCMQRVNTDSDDGLKGAVEVLITEVFGETERSLSKVRTIQPATGEPCQSTAMSTLQWACTHRLLRPCCWWTEPAYACWSVGPAMHGLLPDVAAAPPLLHLLLLLLLADVVWCEPGQQWHHSLSGLPAGQQAVGGISRRLARHLVQQSA
jgi:hypothetical protein